MLCIFNGRVGDDYCIEKETTTAKTVIDYVIGTPSLINNIKQFQIQVFGPLFSDKHCIIEFTMVGKGTHNVLM